MRFQISGRHEYSLVFCGTTTDYTPDRGCRTQHGPLAACCLPNKYRCLSTAAEHTRCPTVWQTTQATRTAPTRTQSVSSPSIRSICCYVYLHCCCCYCYLASAAATAAQARATAAGRRRCAPLRSVPAATAAALQLLQLCQGAPDLDPRGPRPRGLLPLLRPCRRYCHHVPLQLCQGAPDLDPRRPGPRVLLHAAHDEGREGGRARWGQVGRESIPGDQLSVLFTPGHVRRLPAYRLPQDDAKAEHGGGGGRGKGGKGEVKSNSY